ncbi:MAG: hypothetical protein JJE41_08885 [Candidatus Heimdallarchaeota archaeon]|nr:hypothetical protein [Candidatus Heimdallarchaeota archaeon]
MNEKAISLTVFFISVFLFYQIKIILRFRKLRKINSNLNESGFVLGAYFPIGDCCNCLGCLLTPCGIISEDSDEVYEVLQEKRAQRQSDKYEQRNKEKRRIEQEKYIVEIEQERRGRKEKVEKLRANGYTVAEKDRIKVIETVSISTETNLSWTSTATKIPIEKVIIIIEDEPDFEIKDEKIINKIKMPEEEKTKTFESICPNCANPFEVGLEFCLNCGQKL